VSFGIEDHGIGGGDELAIWLLLDLGNLNMPHWSKISNHQRSGASSDLKLASCEKSISVD
jgi:hypothetical protein